MALSPSLKLPNSRVQISRGAFAVGNPGRVYGHDSPYRSFALSLAAPSALPMLPLEEREGTNKLSAPAPLKHLFPRCGSRDGQPCSSPQGDQPCPAHPVRQTWSDSQLPGKAFVCQTVLAAPSATQAVIHTAGTCH